MDCVEARAVEDGHMSIRLCYVDMNVYLEKIYSRRGYVQTGTSGCCCRVVCILPFSVRSSAMHDHSAMNCTEYDQPAFAHSLCPALPM